MKRGQREKTPKAFHDCKIRKNNSTNGLMIHWCTPTFMSYTCPGKPKASVACRSRCLFGGRWPSWVRLMTSYQNHVHDRLRMLYRWFRSYTSLFQAFHISMTLWSFLSLDAAITRITVWHKNYKCFDTVVSYYITLWTRLLRRVVTILVVLSDYPRLLCAKISPRSLPHSMKKFRLEYLQNQTIDKISHYTYHHHQGGGPMHVGQSIRCSQGK